MNVLSNTGGMGGLHNIPVILLIIKKGGVLFGVKSAVWDVVVELSGVWSSEGIFTPSAGFIETVSRIERRMKMNLLFESYQSVSTLEEAFATKEDFLVVPQGSLECIPEVLEKTKEYLIENNHRLGIPFLDFLIKFDNLGLMGLYYQVYDKYTPTEKNPDYIIKVISTYPKLDEMMMKVKCILYV